MMNSAYKLLQEVIWLLDAEEDTSFSPHMLNDLKSKLRAQLVEEVQAFEADSQWRFEDDDSSLLRRILPKGWVPKVRQPSAAMRFTAMSPEVDGHRVVVTADSPDRLERWVSLYNELSIADTEQV